MQRSELNPSLDEAVNLLQVMDHVEPARIDGRISEEEFFVGR